MVSTPDSFAYMLTIYGYGDTDGGVYARRYPTSYVPSGRYDWGDNALDYQEVGGRWWSSTSAGISAAYYLDVNSSRLISQNYNNIKACGRSVRCISAGSVLVRRYPLGLVYSGSYYWNRDGLEYQGFGGFWQSGWSHTDTTNYMTELYPSAIYPNGWNGNKAAGRSLRCP